MDIHIADNQILDFNVRGIDRTDATRADRHTTRPRGARSATGAVEGTLNRARLWRSDPVRLFVRCARRYRAARSSAVDDDVRFAVNVEAAVRIVTGRYADFCTRLKEDRDWRSAGPISLSGQFSSDGSTEVHLSSGPDLAGTAAPIGTTIEPCWSLRVGGADALAAAVRRNVDIACRGET